jgi:energy-coupling factor transporter transmembrane protein EcfT
MDRITLFRYFPAESVIHRTDARIKGFALFLFSILIFQLSLTGGLILLVFSIAAFRISRVPFRSFFVLLWPFYILFGVILLTKLFLNSTGDSRIDNLMEGVFLVFRMVLLILLGHLYTSTTTLEETRKSISWVLKPFPREIGFTISTMLSVTLAFIPLLFSHAREIREAQQARNINAAKNPFRRVKFFVTQVIITTLEKGEQIGEAMESRCYSRDRTVYFPPIHLGSWLFLTVTVAAALLALLLPYTFQPDI